MKSAAVVIGANYGDEGKGLVTDFLASSLEPDLLVRFNGGAQAGHTVVAEGKRHVFHHVGSATFAGVPTLLSKYFVANPTLLADEVLQLRDLGITPRVYLDSRALVTTPFDMLINMLLEEKRGDVRHGSCGVGFGETIARSLSHWGTYHLEARHLESPDELSRKLRSLLGEWLPERLMWFGLTIPDRFKWIENPDTIDRFMSDVEALLETVDIVDGDRTLHTRDRVLFEGAQGLMLDQNHPNYPHVTRSNTGCQNVIELCEGHVDDLNLIYVTRTYLTRHGAGPLPHEQESGALREGLNDETNVAHPFQGELRYAFIDPGALASRIDMDVLLCCSAKLKFTTTLAVTCVDQVGRTAYAYVHGGEVREVNRSGVDVLLDAVKPNYHLESFGSDRSSVRCEKLFNL